jgi:hypothetical protein
VDRRARSRCPGQGCCAYFECLSYINIICFPTPYWNSQSTRLPLVIQSLGDRWNKKKWSSSQPSPATSRRACDYDWPSCFCLQGLMGSFHSSPSLFSDFNVQHDHRRVHLSLSLAILHSVFTYKCFIATDNSASKPEKTRTTFFWRCRAVCYIHRLSPQKMVIHPISDQRRVTQGSCNRVRTCQLVFWRFWALRVLHPCVHKMAKSLSLSYYFSHCVDFNASDCPSIPARSFPLFFFFPLSILEPHSFLQ